MHRPYLLSLYDVTPTPRVLANLVRQGSRRYHAFSAKAYQPISAVTGPFGRPTKRFHYSEPDLVRAQFFTGPPSFPGLGADVACNLLPANLTAAMPACIAWENLPLDRAGAVDLPTVPVAEGRHVVAVRVFHSDCHSSPIAVWTARIQH